MKTIYYIIIFFQILSIKIKNVGKGFSHEGPRVSARGTKMLDFGEGRNFGG